MAVMSKKTKKETLYVDIDADLKQRIQKLADARDRKLTAEVSRALKRYLKEEEPKIDLEESEEAE